MSCNLSELLDHRRRPNTAFVSPLLSPAVETISAPAYRCTGCPMLAQEWPTASPSHSPPRSRHHRSWTVHDGKAFSQYALQATRVCPETVRLIEDTATLVRHSRGRTTPAPRESCAASTLRSLWLVDGTSGPTSREEGTKRARRSVKEASAENVALPVAVVRALHAQNLHSMMAWLDLGGSVHAASDNGSQLLHFSVLQPFNAAVSELLRRGAPVNAQLPHGQTPLLLAAMRAHHSTVSLLLAGGADPNMTDAAGHTALMVVARSGHAEMVRTLLDAGAKTETKDREGHTALWYAVKHEQKGTAIALRQHRAMQLTQIREAVALARAT